MLTGMVATNSVAPKTGNISAGTSIFSMIVLDKSLKNVYPKWILSQHQMAMK